MAMSIKANPHIAAMQPYRLPDLSTPSGKEKICLAQNECFMPPSPQTIAAAGAAAINAQKYPEPDWPELRHALAHLHHISEHNIICSAGSMDLIDCLTRAFCSAEDSIVSSQYSYAFFRTAAEACDATFIQAPEVNLTVSVEALIDHVTENTKIVFVANPGNPTGTRINKQQLVQLRQGLRKDILLVIDEAYGEFADAPGQFTFDMAEKGNTVILRTFSKSYALAGQRIGWGVFPPAIAEEIRKVLIPNNVSVIAEAMAVAAIRDQAYMHTIVQGTIAIRDWFIAALNEMGLSTPDSQTNFVLIPFEDQNQAGKALADLRSEGILLRPMAGFGLPHCLRATIGTLPTMQKVIDLLQNSLRTHP